MPAHMQALLRLRCREEMSAAVAEAEARAAAAEQQRGAAAAELAELKASMAAQASALTSKYEPQLEELRSAADQAAQGAEAAKRQACLLRVHTAACASRSQPTSHRLC